MKKLIALLSISFLINGFNSSPNIDVTEIETETSFLNLLKMKFIIIMITLNL